MAKKDAKLATRNKKPREKKAEDPRRFVIRRNGRQVYPGPGVPLNMAEQLLAGLVERAELVEVKPPIEETT